MDSASNPLECERSDVVPIEPDEKCLAADVVVRHETPIPAVVAVIAIVTHHQVLTGRHPARKTALIVVAIVAARKIADIRWIDRRRLSVDADRMLLRAGGGVRALERALERIEAKSFEVAVRAVGTLRPRLAVDREPLVAVFDDVAADPDHALDEILRGIDRI